MLPIIESYDPYIGFYQIDKPIYSNTNDAKKGKIEGVLG